LVAAGKVKGCTNIRLSIALPLCFLPVHGFGLADVVLIFRGWLMGDKK